MTTATSSIVAPCATRMTPVASRHARGLVNRKVSILGVQITDTTRPRAIRLLAEMLQTRDGRTRRVYFVNAHTLNLAAGDRDYRDVLNAADCAFGDGTGVRWAARMRGMHLRDNLNGTDLVPKLLDAAAERGGRYFLLGADPATIGVAAQFASARFPGWTLCGYHHGYLASLAEDRAAIRQINRARPDLLLVGMGNPRQELWIDEHRDWLEVPLCLAVGGLFDFWAGNVTRAPRWLRRAGHEWLWRLWQHPSDKARRYLLGNPLFLARAVQDAWVNLRTRPIGEA